MQKLKEDQIDQLWDQDSENDDFSNKPNHPREEFWQYLEFKSSRQGICLKNNNTNIATSKIYQILTLFRQHIENNTNEYQGVRWIRIPPHYLEDEIIRSEILKIYDALKYVTMIDIVIPCQEDLTEIKKLVRIANEKDNLSFLNLRMINCQHINEECFEVLNHLSACQKLETLFIYFEGNSLSLEQKFIDGQKFCKLPRLGYFSIVSQAQTLKIQNSLLSSMFRILESKTIKHYKIDMDDLKIRGKTLEALSNSLKANSTLQEFEIERADFDDVDQNSMHNFFDSMLSIKTLQRIGLNSPLKYDCASALLESLELQKVSLEKLVIAMRFTNLDELGRVKNSFGILSKKTVQKIQLKVAFDRQIEDASNLEDLSYIVNIIESQLYLEIEDNDGVLGNSSLKSLFHSLNRSYDIIGLKISTRSNAITEKGLKVVRKSLFKFGSLESFILRADKVEFSRLFALQLAIQLSKISNLHVRELKGQDGENIFDGLKPASLKEKCCNIF